MKANHIKNRIPFAWERKYKFKRQCWRGIFLLEAKMRDMVEYDIRVEKEDCIYFSTILGKTKKWAENDQNQNIQTITCKNRGGKS